MGRERGTLSSKVATHWRGFSRCGGCILPQTSWSSGSDLQGGGPASYRGQAPAAGALKTGGRLSNETVTVQCYAKLLQVPRFSARQHSKHLIVSRLALPARFSNYPATGAQHALEGALICCCAFDKNHLPTRPESVFIELGTNPHSLFRTSSVPPPPIASPYDSHHATTTSTSPVANDLLPLCDDNAREFPGSGPSSRPPLSRPTGRLRRRGDNRGPERQKKEEKEGTTTRTRSQRRHCAVQSPHTGRPWRSGGQKKQARMSCAEARREGWRAVGLQETERGGQRGQLFVT